jgi:hypothetical protein
MLVVARAENGVTPKPKAEDYPVQIQAPGMALGAEYLLFTIANAQQSFVVQDHLVIEVAVYPAKGQRVKVTKGMFTLRLNGKNELPAEEPEVVASDLRYPEWRQSRAISLGAGPITLGGPSARRLPGQTRDPQSKPRPGTTEVTQIDGPDGVPLSGPDAAIKWAFPDGEFGGPVSGFVYFPYRGKAKKITAAELIFHGADKPIVLKLF